MNSALSKRRGILTAAVWLGFIVFTAVFSPLFLTKAAQTMDFKFVLEGPSVFHPMGTDALGRDLFARILLGSSVSMGVGFGAILIALFVGTWFGAIAGYYGRLTDRLLMSIVDVMLCFPTIFLILAVIAILGPSLANVVWIIGLTAWMQPARLVRAQILSLKEREFIMASRVLGAGDSWILARHLIPNALGPVFINGILGLAGAIMTETGLSFLGLGVQPPVPSWGNILMDGKATAGFAWWLLLFPGIMIFFTVLSVNTIGEYFKERFKC